MRLTVSLEGNAEGRVLASVDMEEIVKMTITDDIEKSNFNPQMLKSCTDTSYQCGYEQGRADATQEIKSVIKDTFDVAYAKGRADCLEEFVKNVLYELNGIAEDESYYFDKDNANLVSSVMYSHLEQLKEKNNEKDSACRACAARAHRVRCRR